MTLATAAALPTAGDLRSQRDWELAMLAILKNKYEVAPHERRSYQIQITRPNEWPRIVWSDPSQ